MTAQLQTPQYPHNQGVCHHPAAAAVPEEPAYGGRKESESKRLAVSPSLVVGGPHTSTQNRRGSSMAARCIESIGARAFVTLTLLGDGLNGLPVAGTDQPIIQLWWSAAGLLCLGIRVCQLPPEPFTRPTAAAQPRHDSSLLLLIRGRGRDVRPTHRRGTNDAWGRACLASS